MPGGWHVGSSLGSPQDLMSVTSGGTGLSTLTSGSSAYAKGAWTQITASTAYDSQWMLIQWIKLSYPQTTAIDVGIGSSGNEIALIQNLAISDSNNQTAYFYFPLSIKAGTRVVLRLSTEQSSASCYYRVGLFNDSAWGGGGSTSAIDTYGFNGSTNIGTTVDPGATANTKGAYSQVVASTTNNLDGFFLSFDNQARSSGGASGQDYLVDIAIGASGSEKIIIPNLWTQQVNQSQSLMVRNSSYFPIAIPAGTRVSARCQSAYTTSPDRTIGITFYGARR